MKLLQRNFVIASFRRGRSNLSIVGLLRRSAFGLAIRNDRSACCIGALSILIACLCCGISFAAGLEGAIENAEQPAKAAEASLMTTGEAQEDSGAGLIEWADETPSQAPDQDDESFNEYE